MEVPLHLFLNLELDGGEWLAPRPGCLTQRKVHPDHTHYKARWDPELVRVYWREGKCFDPEGVRKPHRPAPRLVTILTWIIILNLILKAKEQAPFQDSPMMWQKPVGCSCENKNVKENANSKPVPHISGTILVSQEKALCMVLDLCKKLRSFNLHTH
jgi:hypothetical protein